MRSGCISASAAILTALVLAAGGSIAIGDTISIPPDKDNTLYESATGTLSNGVGQHFFVGRVDVISSGAIRRAVIVFDIAGHVPPGSTITAVNLTLNMSRTTVGLQPVSLHRLLADWGEGGSDATGGEGGGTAAVPGDATWLHRFFDTDVWSGPGAAGDFVASASTTIQIGTIGAYTFLSTQQIISDVQGGLDDTGSNFGWILIGNESTIPTSKRFDSKDHLNAAVRPNLTIDFEVAAPPAGAVPDGGFIPGTPLTVEHAGAGEIRMSWGDSCLTGDDDFEIYTGAIGNFTSYSPLSCSTGGATILTISPSAGSRFYFVVPRNAAREGSYGVDSDGVERPILPGGCLSQSIARCP